MHTKNIFLIAIIAISIIGGAFALSLAQQQDPEPATEKKQDQEISENFAAALRAKAAELEKKEQNLLRREQELTLLEQQITKQMQDLQRQRQQFEEERTAFQQRRDEILGQEENQRIERIANGFKNVKANIAAAQLSALYAENASTALHVLSRLDERTFGKIFSKLTDPVLAARMIEDLKQWRIDQTAAGGIAGN